MTTSKEINTMTQQVPIDPSSIWNLPQAAEPYVLRHQAGPATITVGQAIRILAGATQTNGAFTVCHVVGPRGGPIPQHWHKAEHDTFVCLRGGLQLWTDNSSHVLPPGGFGNVPPGVRHAYAFTEHHTEMVGLISPGGFERFFAQTGWRFDGGIYPAADTAPVDQEAFARAGATCDVHFVRDPVYVQPTPIADDATLPAGSSAYCLRPGQGARHALDGLMSTALCAAAQTEGRFGMSTIEGRAGATLARRSFDDAHLFLTVMNGSVTVTLDSESHTLQIGDSINIPAGIAVELVMSGADNRVLAFAQADCLNAYFRMLGKPWEAEVCPEGR